MAPEDALREFHTFFNFPARDEVQLITGEELELRRTLIREEYEELMEALEGDDLQAIYKEAADLIYVVYGLDQHIGSKLAEVFDEVHRSNMSKLFVCSFCDGKGYDPDDSRYFCSGCRNGSGLRPEYRADGKLLKPPEYQTPNLDHIIPKEHQ